jgi:hypothetical protein
MLLLFELLLKVLLQLFNELELFVLLAVSNRLICLHLFLVKRVIYYDKIFI